MSRIRTIKPEFWTDEKVVRLPFEARLLFIGMWNFADDDGILSDHPDSIKLQILPSDDIDVWAIVDLLVASELLDRILLEDGSHVLQIKGFSKHQQISHKTPTKFPVSSGKKQSIPANVRRQVALKYGCEPGKKKDVECYFCGAPGRIWWAPLANGKPSFWVAFAEVELDHLEPENSGGETTVENIVLSCRSCNRSRGYKNASEFISRKFRSFPENTGSLRPEGNGREWKGIDLFPNQESQTEPIDRKRKAKSENPDFETHFWPAYPHKVGKPAASRAFAGAIKKASLDQILAGLDRYVRDKPPDRAWCNPATWLNQERWNDQPAANGGSGQGKPSGRSNGTAEAVGWFLREETDEPGHNDADDRGREESPQPDVERLQLGRR